MSDEFLLISSLDQSIDIDHDWILNRIEEIINHSIQEHDAYIALNACHQLVEVGKLSGKALAKALYLIKKNWMRYQLEEPFEDIAYVHIGLHKHTVDRYVRIWEMFDRNIIPEELKQRNIKDLIPVANALSQGYEIDEEDWEELIDAPDYNTVSRIIREKVKGKEPRKGGLLIFLDRDGTLIGEMNGEIDIGGHLDVKSESEIVRKMIERIKSVGILER